jgi:hypothetical protein
MAMVAAHAQTGESADRWSYEVMPYMWGAGISGREGVGGVTADVSASAKDLFDFVNIGASVRITGHKAPLGFYGEASYVGLQVDGHTAAVGDVRVKSSQTLAELGLSLDVLPQLGLSVYAGARYQDQNAVLEALGLRREGDRSWVDGVAGVKWTPIQLEHWTAWARADVGTGGSDLVWLAEVGGGYHWGSRWAAYLSYRVLDTDYHHEGFLYDVRLSGLLLGFGVKF